MAAIPGEARVPPELDAIEAASRRIEGLAIRTPLLRLQDGGKGEVYLKAESLQPVGSFKIRGAANALLQRHGGRGSRVYTASAGNFAQGLAYAGQVLEVPVLAFVPETAAAAKVDALRRLGTEVRSLPYADWWKMLDTPPDDPMFIHPVADPDVIAGNATIGLELLEDVPELATVLVPYGGGGLSAGIASALRASGSPARTIACESEAGVPLTAAFSAGKPVGIEFDSGTFITGMGGPAVLPVMWTLVRSVISGTALVTLRETADAIRLLFERHHLVVEGAGATPVAAARKEAFDGPVACILSGGHLDPDHLFAILSGDVPS